MITITCSAVVSSVISLNQTRCLMISTEKWFIALINHAKQQNNKKMKKFLKKQKKPFLRNPRKNPKKILIAYFVVKKSARR